MPKTYLLETNLPKIESLNDQLWYYLFATDELNRQTARFSDIAKSNYTVDLFKNNIYSSRIHVKVKALNKFQNENKNLTFGAYFSTCYEISALYIEALFTLLKKINSITNITWKKDKTPEENIKSLLSKGLCTAISINLINTIVYLRKRRNHYTHISEIPDNSLANFITNKSPGLNTYWRTHATTIHLDFTKTLIRDFTQDETIELIKLTRICMIELDNHIANNLNRVGVIKFLIDKQNGGIRKRLNANTRTQLINKIITSCRSKFDIVVTESEVEPHVNSI